MKFRRNHTHDKKAFVTYSFDRYREMSNDMVGSRGYERIGSFVTADAYYIIVKTSKYKSPHPTYTIPVFELDAGIESATKERLDFFD